MPTTDLSDRTLKASDIDPRFISFQTAHKTAADMKKDEKQRNIFRAASMEYLFSNLSSRLLCMIRYGVAILYSCTDHFIFSTLSCSADAEKAAGNIFDRVGHIPKNLITVHVRWYVDHSHCSQLIFL